MVKPRLLDLFCGVGGAAKGYQRAGFYVVGVDREPQPNYCGDEFIQCDALQWRSVDSFDAIHASPPCQRYTTLSAGREEQYPDLYGATRDMLQDKRKPWIIENVCGAPHNGGVLLCGSMFGLAVRRHRNFECSWYCLAPSCQHDLQPEPILVSGKAGGNTLRHRKGIKSDWPKYMGMEWATPEECTQAIPPAFTEYIGTRLMEYLNG